MVVLWVVVDEHGAVVGATWMLGAGCPVGCCTQTVVVVVGTVVVVVSAHPGGAE